MIKSFHRILAIILLCHTLICLISCSTENNINGVNGFCGELTATNSNYIHISFDDVEKCMNNLINNHYSSLFNEPFFNWLRDLHDEYGAKFSLYTYLNKVSEMPDAYKKDFTENSSWLKFGLHSKNSSDTYENATYEQAANDWNAFVMHVIRFSGSFDSVDRVPRLHYFSGSSDALQGMRDANCGALGFLSADDSRISYDFSDAQADYLKDHDSLLNTENGLMFFKTDMRGDWFTDNFTSVNIYTVPSCETVYDELVYRFSQPQEADAFRSYIFFAHEWQFYNGHSLNQYKKWTEDACRFADDHKLSFDYPQNRIHPGLIGIYLN